MIPRRTYILESENKKTVRGINAMNAKDRVTELVCTNVDGSDKVPMSTMQSLRTLRDLKLELLPFHTIAKIMLGHMVLRFSGGLLSFFFLIFEKRTNKLVALVMNNCGAHGSDLKDIRGQVSMLKLPPSCTSLHQPIDIGIIAN